METDEIPQTEGLRRLPAVTVEIACQEARRLGQALVDLLLKTRTLVEDQPTYDGQVNVWDNFLDEANRSLRLSDSALMGFDELIEWKE
jgi:hypothetical protein